MGDQKRGQRQESDEDLVRASGRVPPQSLQAEIGVLGCILLDNRSFHSPDFPSALRPEDFYRTPHQVIYRTMVEMLVENEPVDIVTLVERLQSKGLLEAAKGAAYLSGLTDQVASTANVKAYAAIVLEKSVRRAVIWAHSEAINVAYDDLVPANEVLQRGEELLAAVPAPRANAVTMRQAVLKVWKSIEERWDDANPAASRAFFTGFKKLDEILRIRKSHFVIVASRPGDGKTTWLLQTARRVAAKVGPVAFVSIEMEDEELVEKALQDAGNLHEPDVIRPRSEAADRTLRQASDDLAPLPITILDEDDPVTIMREALRMKRSKAGLAALFIDYIQLLEISRDWGENRDIRLGQLTRRLKRFAKTHDVPVIAAAQLKRIDHLQKGRSPVPTLNDLRESGNLEQDANSVILLYRPGVIQGTEEHDRGDWRYTRAIVAKNRGGRANVYAELVAEFEYQRFVEMPMREEESPQVEMPLAGGKRRVHAQ